MELKDDPASAGGAAAPDASAPAAPQPAKAGFFSRAEHEVEDLAKRVEDAIERWYAAHYHAATLAGRAPITTDDKAALVSSVTAVVAPAKE